MIYPYLRRDLPRQRRHGAGTPEDRFYERHAGRLPRMIDGLMRRLDR